MTDRFKEITENDSVTGDQEEVTYSNQRREVLADYTAQGIRKAIDRAGLNDPDVVREKRRQGHYPYVTAHIREWLVQAGVSLAKVSKLLGHSSVTTTEIYAHLASNEVSEEAVEVLNRLTANPVAERW